jgi:hypothetical protein
MQRIFTHIRQVNLWESSESVSGRGSEYTSTAPIRSILPDLFSELNICSILDAPCGDFNWMQHVPLSGIAYTGVDVVSELIEQNQQRYGTETIRFMNGNITRDLLPKADLILCRDGLVHLPLRDICRALSLFKRSGAKYLLTTTYPVTGRNQDAPVGSWRALNLCGAPFNFSTPLKQFNDPSDHDTGLYPDKSLALWHLDAITPPVIPAWNSPMVSLITLVRQYINPSWKL